MATRKPSGFDHYVIFALRKSAQQPIPIGPPWLQEAARDVTSLGSVVVLLIMTFAVAGYLFLDRKPGVAWLMLIAVIGGLALNNLLKFVFARPRPEVVSSCAARFHDKLPKRARHIVCDHLFDDRCPSRPSLPCTNIGLLLHVTRGASNGPHRPQPDLSWCSFSDGYSRRLVHRYGLGHRLLGAVGLASASRPARIRRSDVTAIRHISAGPLGA